MKQVLLIAALAAPIPALADGFVLGAGRWTCGDALQVSQSGSPSQVGQLAGWIMGYWSAETFHRETRFVDIVESVGAEQVFKSTLEECGKAPADTAVFRVVQSMIRNTR